MKTGGFRRIDLMPAARPRQGFRMANERIIGCRADTEAATLVFAVDFLVRCLRNLATDEQGAER